MSDIPQALHDVQQAAVPRASRFIIEGEWSGYLSSQQRVVHRKVYPANRKKLRAWVEKTHAILYTDGTALYLTVRDCKPRERVKEINGYTPLIEDCFYQDVTSVAALTGKREARRTPASVPEEAPAKSAVCGSAVGDTQEQK